MENQSLESLALEQSQEAALAEKAKDKTKQALLDEIKLMQIALSQIDIYNLRRGPYTNTVAAKIAFCREILTRNGEAMIPPHVDRVYKILARIEKLLNKKDGYCKKIDRYLEAKENSVIEAVRSNLLDLDLQKFEIIRNRLVKFRDDLKIASTRLATFVSKTKCLKPTPTLETAPVPEPINTIP